jgi:phosphoglycerate kinase
MEGLEKADICLLENLSEFKEEVANCSKFAQMLSSGVDIFVNDSFSQSHKILASTVGVTRFCHSCVAGFHFEESLCQLKMVAETSRNPYVAVVRLCCCCCFLQFLIYLLNSETYFYNFRSLECILY